jgi:DNA mismatch repair ATPase MutS
MAGRGEEAPIVFLATHFHEIVEKQVLPRATFTRCTMDVRIEGGEKLTFLYRVVRDGEPIGESFGLQCALRAGLDHAIVHRARIVADCGRTGVEIPPNEECLDRVAEERSRAALALFFGWDGISNPRPLLMKIKRTLTGE